MIENLNHDLDEKGVYFVISVSDVCDVVVPEKASFGSLYNKFMIALVRSESQVMIRRDVRSFLHDNRSSTAFASALTTKKMNAL